MTLNDLAGYLAEAQKDIKSDPHDSFMALYRLTKALNEELRDSPIVARFEQPMMVMMTGALQGQAVFIPAHVVLVPRLVQSNDGIERGRGVCLKEAGGKLEFFTQLEECFAEPPKSPTILIHKWMEGIIERA